jgi:hypothetical protein
MTGISFVQGVSKESPIKINQCKIASPVSLDLMPGCRAAQCTYGADGLVLSADIKAPGIIRRSPRIRPACTPPGKDRQSAYTTDNAHAYIRKFDGYGKEIWKPQFDEPSGETGVAASGESVYVAGNTESGPNRNGTREFFLRRYDSNGNGRWTQQFGGPLDDGRAVEVAADDTALRPGSLFHLRPDACPTQV